MKLWMTLWKDERGFVLSAEMILIATIACIGLIVGMVTYRDAIVQELGDTGAAINAMNQSYAIAIADNAAAGIVVTGDTVTITSTFGDVVVTASFQNYDYADQLDLCETTVQTAGEPPAGITVPASVSIEEGTALPAP